MFMLVCSAWICQGAGRGSEGAGRHKQAGGFGVQVQVRSRGGARRHRGMRDEAGRALIPFINQSKLYPIAY
jgi:hypothetical protein